MSEFDVSKLRYYPVVLAMTAQVCEKGKAYDIEIKHDDDCPALQGLPECVCVLPGVVVREMETSESWTWDYARGAARRSDTP